MIVWMALVGTVGCAGEPFQPGAGQAGDPYFPTHGNGGYQVDHYQLAVRYNPETKELTGAATLTATTTQDLSRFSLDLVGLAVEQVTVDGANAEVDQQPEKLIIAPAAGLPERTQFTIEIDYGGVPAPLSGTTLGSNGFHHTADGAFAAGQPRSASTWYPVNDHPLDKAGYTVEITVPAGLAAISNGVPVEVTTTAGWSTWRWVESAPMASYLSVLAIGDYRVTRGEHSGQPSVVAVHSDLPADVDEQLLRTGEIADVLAGWFGPYPFDSYGGIALADDQVRFALETQSRPVYSPAFFAGAQDATWVIVHELAHQWFGNSVSVRHWDDIWLNEGFATYAEWLWEEHHGGDTAQELFDLYWDGPGGEPDFWTVLPGDPGPDDLFDSAVYVRGAMTVHALRRAVGDTVFFEILPAWTAAYRYGNATTADLADLSERVSGQSLGGLFDDWLYTPRQPPRPER